MHLLYTNAPNIPLGTKFHDTQDYMLVYFMFVMFHHSCSNVFSVKSQLQMSLQKKRAMTQVTQQRKKQNIEVFKFTCQLICLHSFTTIGAIFVQFHATVLLLWFKIGKNYVKKTNSTHRSAQVHMLITMFEAKYLCSFRKHNDFLT